MGGRLFGHGRDLWNFHEAGLAVGRGGLDLGMEVP